MAQRNYVGFDCGTTTGVAFVDGDGRIQELRSTNFWGAVGILDALRHLEAEALLADEYVETIVVVEDPNEIRTIYDRHRRQPVAEVLKIAQNVGGVKRETQLVVAAAEARGFRVVRVKPDRRKLGAKAFARFYDWEDSTNEHERDAARITVSVCRSERVILDRRTSTKPE